MVSNRHTEKQSFVEDIADALCAVNDNDKEGIRYKLDTSYLMDDYDRLPEDLTLLDPKGYQDLRYRKARQMRGVLKHGDEKEKENAPSAQESEEKDLLIKVKS